MANHLEMFPTFLHVTFKVTMVILSSQQKAEKDLRFHSMGQACKQWASLSSYYVSLNFVTWVYLTIGQFKKYSLVMFR